MELASDAFHQSRLKSYAELIIEALHNEPTHRLDVDELYVRIFQAHPEFKATDRTRLAKISIRNQLSKSGLFRQDGKSPKVGKGQYWTFVQSIKAMAILGANPRNNRQWDLDSSHTKIPKYPENV